MDGKKWSNGRLRSIGVRRFCLLLVVTLGCSSDAAAPKTKLSVPKEQASATSVDVPMSPDTVPQWRAAGCVDLLASVAADAQRTYCRIKNISGETVAVALSPALAEFRVKRLCSKHWRDVGALDDANFISWTTLPIPPGHEFGVREIKRSEIGDKGQLDVACSLKLSNGQVCTSQPVRVFSP